MMFRNLVTSLTINFKIQNRNGFYYATLFMLVVSIFLLQFLDLSLKIRFLPLMITTNIISATGGFLAILVLFEKQEKSYYALLVTPMSNNIYLVSKIFILTILSLVEGLGLFFFSIDNHSNIVYVGLGITFFSIIYCLLGYSLALWYSNFNEIIFPLVGLMILVSLNLFLQLAGISNPLLVIFPGFAPFQLIYEGINLTITFGHVITYIFLSIFWIMLFYYLSKRVFNRFIVELEV